MKSKILFLSLVALSGVLSAVSPVFAQGVVFTYQGRLSDGSGPANGTNYGMVFYLYDAPTNGTQLGNVGIVSVSVSNGLFTVPLGFDNGFDGNPRWLEISVQKNGGSFTSLVPRQQVTATPYAIMANSASNLLGALPAAQLSGSLGNSQLANSTLTVNAAAGLSGGGIVALGGSTTLSNTGVLSITGNPDITASSSNGAVMLAITATSSNTPGSIVKRDANGSFAAGSLTLDGTVVAGDVKLASGAQSAVSALDSPRIVWGAIHGDGTIAWGTGFTVSKNAVGSYTLIFTPSFNGPPSVVFSPPYGQPVGWTTTFGSLATNSVVMKTWNGSFQADADFDFMAIGPR